MSYILELFKLFGTTPKQKKNNFINVFLRTGTSVRIMSICNGKFIITVCNGLEIIVSSVISHIPNH